jgi:hypothetical protein
MDEYTTIVKDFFGVSSLEPTYLGQHYDLRQLVTALVRCAEPDMNRFACSEALDCMVAYYKVAYFSCVFCPYFYKTLADAFLYT